MAVPEFYSGKVLYPAIAVLLALSGLFGLAILPRLVPKNPLVGQAAPAFVLPVAANGDPGARLDLGELKGHAVVLDFWASWCGPCAVEAPVLDRLARRYEKQGLVVVGVNVSDAPATIKAYAAQRGLSYPMVVDGHDASDRYGVDKLPSLVVIDKQGKVAAFFVGVVDESALDEALSAVL
ncbi:MAG TPA: TlpA disulfide reductase family protein [Minicystis sp.]|nr:TlpA disulfide reductase family protein [Minicystis sp.]